MILHCISFPFIIMLFRCFNVLFPLAYNYFQINFISLILRFSALHKDFFLIITTVTIFTAKRGAASFNSRPNRRGRVQNGYNLYSHTDCEAPVQS